MHQISRISLSNLFTKSPIRQSRTPIFSFSSNSATTISNHQHFLYQISPPKPLLFNLLISEFHSFLHPRDSNPSTHTRNHQDVRKLSGDSEPSFEQNKIIDEINLKFAEAREEIEMAMESKETVYFDEEAECARDAVKEVLDMFNGLMDKLPENEKGALQRSMGLKIGQLKAELQQLDE